MVLLKVRSLLIDVALVVCLIILLTNRTTFALDSLTLVEPPSLKLSSDKQPVDPNAKVSSSRYRRRLCYRPCCGPSAVL